MRLVASRFYGCLALAVILAACGGPEPAKEQPPVAKPAAPSMPLEFQAAAEASLGAEAEVLAHGDLSLSGNPQVLVINRLKTTPKGVAPGILFTRAVILGKEGDKWQEIFRCDEHLKNQKGFLGATPLVPITGWRLQQEQNKEKGLVMYFTPIQQPASGTIQPIGVRWNPKVKRYQSLDRNYQNFLGEVAALEKPETYLR